MKEKIKYVLPNELEQLAKLMEWVDGLPSFQELSPRTQYSLQLALEEMVSNIIKYGFQDNYHHEIIISLEFMQNGDVKVTLEDDGYEFNPILDAPKTELNPEILDQNIGGIGVFLVKAMSREMSYVRRNNANVLEFTIMKK